MYIQFKTKRAENWAENTYTDDSWFIEVTLRPMSFSLDKYNNHYVFCQRDRGEIMISYIWLISPDGRGAVN